MNKLTAQLALDPPTMGEEVHQAQEGDGDNESEESGEVGVHKFNLIECLIRNKKIIDVLFRIFFVMSPKVSFFASMP